MTADIKWAKGDDLNPSAFYIVGQLVSKELIIVAGPYTSYEDAADERLTFTGHPDYSRTMVLVGASCHDLRTWEDLS